MTDRQHGPGRARNQVAEDRATHRGTPAAEYTRRPAPADTNRVAVKFWAERGTTPEQISAMSDSEFDVWIHRDRDQDQPTHEVEKVPPVPRKRRIVRDQAPDKSSDEALAEVRNRLERPERKVDQ
jgi:hypothetical protein